MKGRSILTRVSRLLVVTLVVSPLAGGHNPNHQLRTTGEIKGTLTVSKTDERTEDHVNHALVNRYMTDPAGAELMVDPSDRKPYTLSEKAVIYLESEESRKQEYPVPTVHRVLEQKGLKFHPEVLPVLVGTTVDFPNGDNLFHNVFSYSQTKEFDLGRYPIRDSRSVVFDRPGVVRVYCDIHSQMNAIILVLENPLFVSPDNDGNFRIVDVPEGRYLMCVWYGRDVILRRSIVIRAEETTVVNLVY